MSDYHTHFVFAAGILTVSACLALHSFFMFMVLQSQLAFRKRFPQAAGVGLVVPSITTLGKGKHVLVAPYCVLEPMEATNGILVAGLNTAILFAILSSVARRHAGYDDLLK